MTPTLDCSPSRPKPAQTRTALRETFVWTVKERDPKTGLWLPRARGKNIHTNFGLTAYAGGFQGSYQAPVYMVIDTFAPTLVSLSGTTLVLQASQQPTLASDTQLVLSVGTANQETIGFAAGSPVVNGNQYTYTLAATPTYAHAVGDICVRATAATDTLTSVFAEAQYDGTNAPGQRMQSIGGYSPGGGQWTMQFFFNANQALLNFVTLGLADSATIGQGNLHNHLVLGYVHTTGNDAEIDVTLTLSNN